jgi:hypothetical protein
MSIFTYSVHFLLTDATQYIPVPAVVIPKLKEEQFQHAHAESLPATATWMEENTPISFS